MKKLLISVISISLLLLFACDKEDTGNNEENPIDMIDGGIDQNMETYDAEELLKSWTNNHIIPDYIQFSALTAELVDEKDDFIRKKSSENFKDLKEAYLNAYTYFQRIGMYNVGLAANENYYSFLNVYPTTTALVDSNIETGISLEGLTTVAQQPAQGFPAIDYLLDVIESTEKDALTDAQLEYLSIVVDKIDSLTNSILQDWQNGFDETFIANSVAGSSGSPSVFYNALIFYFENNLRRQKIDIPAGVFTSNTFPNTIESLFDPAQSRDLLLEAFQQFEAFYKGKENDTESLSTAIIKVGREDLDTAIKNQFNVAEQAIANLDENLSNQIETDNIEMLEVRDEIQQLVIYFKSDVASALNLSILFADNDGD